MLRMSKLTDYGLVLLTHMAQEGTEPPRTAQGLAERSGVPTPTVSKILKELSKTGIVISQRGRHGGYTLARPADQISVAAVIEALEGPVALTECSGTEGGCSLEPTCVARARWGPISRAIHRTLQRLPVSALGPRPILGEARGAPVARSTPSLTVLNP
jgi:FeS assembly SUF system regulator